MRPTPSGGNTRLLAAVGLCLLAAACSTQPSGTATMIGASTRAAEVPTPAQEPARPAPEPRAQARPAEPSPKSLFWRSFKEAQQLEEQARGTGDAAKYLRSAAILDGCAEVEGGMAAVGERKVMQASAMAVQNRLKGGDLAAAREALEQFTERYRGKDLYLADGSSFRDSMAVLLDQADAAANPPNLSAALRQELRRVRYWRHR